jgi:hypothetical protein
MSGAGQDCESSVIRSSVKHAPEAVGYAVLLTHSSLLVNLNRCLSQNGSSNIIRTEPGSRRDSAVLPNHVATTFRKNAIQLTARQKVKSHNKPIVPSPLTRA